MIPSELREKAFHRYSKDQGTVSNSLPEKRHGPHLPTRECLLGPVTLEKIQLHFEEKKKSGDSEKENLKN